MTFCLKIHAFLNLKHHPKLFFLSKFICIPFSEKIKALMGHTEEPIGCNNCKTHKI